MWNTTNNCNKKDNINYLPTLTLFCRVVCFWSRVFFIHYIKNRRNSFWKRKGKAEGRAKKNLLGTVKETNFFLECIGRFTAIQNLLLLLRVSLQFFATTTTANIPYLMHYMVLYNIYLIFVFYEGCSSNEYKNCRKKRKRKKYWNTTAPTFFISHKR